MFFLWLSTSTEAKMKRIGWTLCKEGFKELKKSPKEETKMKYALEIMADKEICNDSNLNIQYKD